MRRQLLLFPLLLLLLLILRETAGRKLLPNGYKWRSGGVHPKFVGKGDFKLLSRRSQPVNLSWKVSNSFRS